MVHPLDEPFQWTWQQWGLPLVVRQGWLLWVRGAGRPGMPGLSQLPQQLPAHPEPLRTQCPASQTHPAVAVTSLTIIGEVVNTSGNEIWYAITAAWLDTRAVANMSWEIIDCGRHRQSPTSSCEQATSGRTCKPVAVTHRAVSRSAGGADGARAVFRASTRRVRDASAFSASTCPPWGLSCRWVCTTSHARGEGAKSSGRCAGMLCRLAVNASCTFGWHVTCNKSKSARALPASSKQHRRLGHKELVNECHAPRVQARRGRTAACRHQTLSCRLQPPSPPPPVACPTAERHHPPAGRHQPPEYHWRIVQQDPGTGQLTCNHAGFQQGGTLQVLCIRRGQHRPPAATLRSLQKPSHFAFSRPRQVLPSPTQYADLHTHHIICIGLLQCFLHLGECLFHGPLNTRHLQRHGVPSQHVRHQQRQPAVLLPLLRANVFICIRIRSRGLGLTKVD